MKTKLMSLVVFATTLVSCEGSSISALHDSLVDDFKMLVLYQEFPKQTSSLNDIVKMNRHRGDPTYISTINEVCLFLGDKDLVELIDKFKKADYYSPEQDALRRKIELFGDLSKETLGVPINPFSISIFEKYKSAYESTEVKLEEEYQGKTESGKELYIVKDIIHNIKAKVIIDTENNTYEIE
ncbi:hypothetical protein AGMMS49965_00710 [Bacteroidia bacterium]|nr:hypothetical protein AGMMS49965_00710 [Bacteroidia bacterium]